MELNWLSYAAKELQFVKSFDDLINLYRKSPFLLQKLIGSKYRTDSLPLSLQIEITNCCNISCTCCPRNSLTREKGYMEMALFRKIIDEAAAVGIYRVHLYLYGEPFLHPEIINMIGHIKKNGMGLSLATNGMLLTRNRSEKLLACGLNNADHIMFSVLGFSKEVHEKTMPEVHHETVVQNIHDLLELRTQHRLNGPLVEAVMYKMPENMSEGPDFVKFWSGIVDHVRWIGGISRRHETNSDSKETKSTRTGTCKDLWQRITILWNGDVTVCCADVNGSLVLGNLGEKSLLNIWKSDQLVAIKTLHKQKKINELSMCRYCDWQ